MGRPNYYHYDILPYNGTVWFCNTVMHNNSADRMANDVEFHTGAV